MSNAEFSMQLLPESEIEHRRKRLVRVTRAIHLVSAVVAFGLIQWGVLHDGGRNAAIGLVIGAIMAFLAWMVISIAIEDTRLDPERYTWLPTAMCESFAEFCEENDGVQGYRNKVRDAARRFTMEEYSAMKSWVSEQREDGRLAEQRAKERAGCQRLYGIADEA
jgi:hypothetical protein